MIAIVAVLCQISGGSCVEEVVTNQAGPYECLMQSQQGIAKWMNEHPRYSDGGAP
jgi:hypothetical protein